MGVRVTRRKLLTLAAAAGAGGLAGVRTAGSGRQVARAAASPAQELVIAFTVDINSLDGRFVFSTQGVSITNHVYEPLVTFDERGTLQPKLAERWEILDPQTIRFHLRRGVKFHNGEPFDAQAVKYTLESIVDPAVKSPQRPFLSTIDHVEAVGPYTADVRLNAPGARSVVRTLTYWGRIMPPQFSRQSGDRFTRAVGTGPYRMVEYRQGDRFVVERNSEYWGKPGATPRIVFRVIPEAGTRVAALERGEIDIADNFPIDQIPRISRNPALLVFSKPTVRVAVVGFKVDRKPVDDPRVRQALAMAINRADINNQLLGGRGRVANSVLTPEVFGYDKAVSPPSYDPARARQLLAEAGVRNYRMKFGTSNARFQNDRQIGEAVAAYFGQVGVQVDLDAPDFGTFFRELYKPDAKYDAYMVSWATNTLDADFGLATPFHERLSTLTNYKNSEVSRLIEQARAATDEKQARALYAKTQEILMRELPWIPMVAVPEVVGMSRRVHGLQLRPDETIFFWDVTKQ